MRRARVPLLLGVVVAVAALLRFWQLGHQSLWYDEAVTSWLMRYSLGYTLAALQHTESTPPLYYMLVWGWARLFGNSELGLRSLSAVAGVAAVPATFAAARALIGPRVGLVAAALLAVNPFAIWYSQEARAYSLLVLMVALSMWLFALARARPAAGRLVAWAVIASLAVCTHYFAIFAIAPQALLLLADRRGRLAWRLAALAIVGATAALLVSLAASQGSRRYYFARISVPRRTVDVASHFLVGFTPPAGTAVALLAGAAVLVALLLLARRSGPRERSGAIVAAAVGIGAVGVPIAMAVVGVDFLNTRNVIAGLIPLVIVVAAGLGARRAGIAGLGVAAVLVAISVSQVVAMLGASYAQRPPWKPVTAALRSLHGPRAILMLGSKTWVRPIGTYWREVYYMPPEGRMVREIDVLRRVPTARACFRVTWWGATCDIATHTALRASPVRGFRHVGTLRVAGFEIARYRAPHPIRIYPHPPLGRRTRADQLPFYTHNRKVLVTPQPQPRL